MNRREFVKVSGEAPAAAATAADDEDRRAHVRWEQEKDVRL